MQDEVWFSQFFLSSLEAYLTRWLFYVPSTVDALYQPEFEVLRQQTMLHAIANIVLATPVMEGFFSC